MRAKTEAVASVLFGKGRGAILGVLYGHPDQSFYYRQLTRELKDVSVGTLQRELETLSQLGLIERSTLGKQVFYLANRSHPISQSYAPCWQRRSAQLPCCAQPSRHWQTGSPSP